MIKPLFDKHFIPYYIFGFENFPDLNLANAMYYMIIYSIKVS